MNSKQINYFKSRLLEESKEIRKSLENMDEREEDENEQLNNELSSYGNHPGDIGTEVYMIEQDKGFRNKLEDKIKEIDDSLDNIRNDKYGYCYNCEKEINEERLEIIPYAKTCLNCMEEVVENKDVDPNEKLGDKRNTSEESLGYNREYIYRDMLEDNIVSNDPSFSTGDNIGIEEEENEEI